MRHAVGLLGMLACAVGLAPSAWSLEPSKDYLAGTWAVGGADACGTATAEQMTFDANGTFTTMSGDQPTAAGFWHLVEDHLDLHMATSPAFFDDPTTDADDALREFAGQYAYFSAKALIFDAEQDSFRTVAAMGDMMRGANYRRCP